jgi:RNA polymerase sigma-70 factor (ECF subfamily)
MKRLSPRADTGTVVDSIAAQSARARQSSLRRASVVHLPVPEGDAALVEALRRDRPGARAALFDRYAAHVRRVLVRVLGLDSEIPDLVHDVFVTALEGIDRLEDGAALRGYLTSIAVYSARGLIRKRSRRRILSFLEPEQMDRFASVGATDELHEAVRALYDVLGAMPADERIAFALRFIEGMELPEIAAACRVSRATVSRRLSRAQRAFVERATRHPALAEWLSGGTRWNR